MNKIEDAGELPGLMIEEMMESASMVQGDQEEGAAKEHDEKVDIRSFLAPTRSSGSHSVCPSVCDIVEVLTQSL